MHFPRIAFELDGVSIFPEPFVFYLATFVVVWLFRRSLARAGIALSRKTFLALGLFSIGFMLVGTRLWFYVVFDPSTHFGNWVRGAFDVTGLASLGLYLGFFAGVLAWGYLWLRKRTRRYRELTKTVLNHVCAYLPLGTFIGRVGCFLDGHKLGKPTDLPWGLVRDDPHDIARHPLDLYQVLAALGLFFVLCAVRRRQGSYDNVELFYVVLFASSHFALDFFSREAVYRPFLELTADQVACLGVIALRLALHFKDRVPAGTFHGTTRRIT